MSSNHGKPDGQEAFGKPKGEEHPGGERPKSKELNGQGAFGEPDGRRAFGQGTSDGVNAF